MNKIYASVLMVLLLLASCSKDKSETPEPNYEMALRSVSAFMTPYDSGKPISALKFLWTMESYTADGLISRRIYRSTYDLDKGCSCSNDETYIHSNGVLKERYVKNLTFNTTKYIYSYSDDRISEMEEYLNTGELNSIYKYEYERGASPSRKLHYYPDQSSHFAQHIYTYDENDRLLMERVVYFNNVEHTIEWVYDEKGNLIWETLNAPGRASPLVRQQNKYTYDSKGRILEREFSTDLGFNPQKWVYHYDDRKNSYTEELMLIEVFEATAPNVYDLKGVISYEYSYELK